MTMKMIGRLRRITVRKSPLDNSKGWLTAGPFRFRAALGKGGVHVFKREGDGRTPIGLFRLHRLWLRPDQPLDQHAFCSNRPECIKLIANNSLEQVFCEKSVSTFSRPALARSSGLVIRMTRRDDIWCDDKTHRLYNKPSRAPFNPSHEEMWRKDHLYDAVVEIGWNMTPAIKGHGSAIFLHLARPGYEPTAGCVALARGDMAKLLPRLARDCRIRILR